MSSEEDSYPSSTPEVESLCIAYQDAAGGKQEVPYWPLLIYYWTRPYNLPCFYFVSRLTLSSCISFLSYPEKNSSSSHWSWLVWSNSIYWSSLRICSYQCRGSWGSTCPSRGLFSRLSSRYEQLPGLHGLNHSNWDRIAKSMGPSTHLSTTSTESISLWHRWG